MTFREIIYYVVDFVKSQSDDSVFNEDHILFLLTKYRGYLLKQEYSNVKKDVSDSNYLTICINLKDFNNNLCGSNFMRISESKIPNIMTIGTKSVSPAIDFTAGRIIFTNPTKFKYVGGNPFLKNDSYFTISLEDGYGYFKSDNQNFKFLDKIRLTAIFEDVVEAAKLDCTCDCGLMDKEFPLEENYCATLAKVVGLDILAGSYNTIDDTNNATDDLGQIGNLISNYTNNKFKNLMKGYQQQPESDSDTQQ